MHESKPLYCCYAKWMKDDGVLKCKCMTKDEWIGEGGRHSGWHIALHEYPIGTEICYYDEARCKKACEKWCSTQFPASPKWNLGQGPKVKN